MNFTNFSAIMENFMGWSLQGYGIMGMGLFWAVMFTSVGTYLYTKNRSLMVFAVFILIVFAAFGNALLGVDAWVSAMQVLVALVFMGMVIVFYMKRKG